MFACRKLRFIQKVRHYFQGREVSKIDDREAYKSDYIVEIWKSW